MAKIIAFNAHKTDKIKNDDIAEKAKRATLLKEALAKRKRHHGLDYSKLFAGDEKEKSRMFLSWYQDNMC